jgi:hypothetical protein
MLKKLMRYEWLIFLVILGVFVCNGLYVSYPDEYVNLLAGKVINSGHLPYKEFFDHHLPFAWYFGAFLLKVTFNNYVLFRIAWATFAFVLLLAVGLYIKRTNREMYPYYRFFFFLYPFFTVYFWLHLYVADALAVLFFSASFWITLNETFRDKRSIFMLMIGSFLNFALIFSSLTFIYLTAALYIWQMYLILRDNWKSKDIIAYLVVTAFPYVYFGLNLLATGTLKDFYIANYYYNNTFYVHIKNYTPGGGFNPIKLGGAIIHNFYDDYLPLLTKIKYLDLYLPILTLSALSTLLLLIYFFIENKFLFVFYFIILSFSAPRSNITQYAETDYQAGMFLTLGLLSSFVVLYLAQKKQYVEKTFNFVKNAGVGLMAIFLLFTSIFLIKNTYDKAFLRYIAFMPGISNHSFVANFADEILKPGEYFWIGPYEPNHEYEVENGILPGKFPTLLPQFRESEYFSKQFIAQFEENPPVFLIFKHESSIFMTPADQFGKFFIEWMKGKYVTIEMLPGYEQVKSPTEFTLKGDLYINVNHQEEILQRLMDAGYVKRS